MPNVWLTFLPNSGAVALLIVVTGCARAGETAALCGHFVRVWADGNTRGKPLCDNLEYACTVFPAVTDANGRPPNIPQPPGLRYDTAMAVAPRPFDCEIHLAPTSGEGCVYCRRFLTNPPDTAMMTPSMRAEELEQWLLSAYAVPADLIYRRVEQLLGRMVSVHELDDPARLIQEVHSGRRQSAWWDDDWN